MGKAGCSLRTPNQVNNNYKTHNSTPLHFLLPSSISQCIIIYIISYISISNRLFFFSLIFTQYLHQVTFLTLSSFPPSPHPSYKLHSPLSSSYTSSSPSSSSSSSSFSLKVCTLFSS